MHLSGVSPLTIVVVMIVLVGIVAFAVRYLWGY